MLNLIKKSLTLKFIIYIVGLLAIMLTLSSLIQVSISSSNLRETLEENSVAFTETTKGGLTESYIEHGKTGRLKVNQKAINLLDSNPSLKAIEIIRIPNEKRVYYINNDDRTGLFEKEEVTPWEAEKVRSLATERDIITKNNKEYLEVISPHIGTFGTREYAVRYLYSLEEVNNRVEESTGLVLGFVIIAIILGGILAVFLAREITKPVNKLTEKARKISLGREDVEIEFESEDEIGSLAKSIKRLQKTYNFLLREEKKGIEKESESSAEEED